MTSEKQRTLTNRRQQLEVMEENVRTLRAKIKKMEEE